MADSQQHELVALADAVARGLWPHIKTTVLTIFFPALVIGRLVDCAMDAWNVSARPRKVREVADARTH